jgi:hypothetical protein
LQRHAAAGDRRGGEDPDHGGGEVAATAAYGQRERGDRRKPNTVTSAPRTPCDDSTIAARFAHRRSKCAIARSRRPSLAKEDTERDGQQRGGGAAIARHARSRGRWRLRPPCGCVHRHATSAHAGSRQHVDGSLGAGQAFNATTAIRCKAASFATARSNVPEPQHRQPTTW